ncbi:hypothetical protein PUR71_24615 [Streptomyces sp. SP17BM10]|uniref:hypothetical protein n=1 Tax=Streptomyces sp. SP17BM10 TaxID=3002530 RepID=UPI002E76782F|nr:hypothetical protein [Streptomyces sp. SP17BM10]MEE1786055.1 hypothetical protein [Streptomyces sp. SP17BM10]
MTDPTPAEAPAVPPGELTDLVRRTPLSFLGTVTRTGGTPLPGLPADEHTAVIKVDHVLHAPDAFRRLAGSQVTVQLLADAAPLAVGDSAAFFTEGLYYGSGLAVSEVGRLPAHAVRPHVALAATTADEMPFSAVLRRIHRQDLATHAREADAVLLGTVSGLERIDGSGHYSEHDPDWWRATLDVQHVEHGAISADSVSVLYPNSRDRHWNHVPKPRAGQAGLWILHATEGDRQQLAPYALRDADDYQPAHRLAALREGM